MILLNFRARVHTLERKSHLCIPRKRIARPQSQFPHSCELFIRTFPWSVYIFPPAEQADPSWEYKNRSQTHKCGNYSRTESPRNSFSGNCFEFSVLCLSSAVYRNLTWGRGRPPGQPRRLLRGWRRSASPQAQSDWARRWNPRGCSPWLRPTLLDALGIQLDHVWVG